MPTSGAPGGSSKPSPEWNPDAEVGRDYRIIPRRCVSGDEANPGLGHRSEHRPARNAPPPKPTRSWRHDELRQKVTQQVIRVTVRCASPFSRSHRLPCRMGASDDACPRDRGTDRSAYLLHGHGRALAGFVADKGRPARDSSSPHAEGHHDAWPAPATGVCPRWWPRGDYSIPSFFSL